MNSTEAFAGSATSSSCCSGLQGIYAAILTATCRRRECSNLGTDSLRIWDCLFSLRHSLGLRLSALVPNWKRGQKPKHAKGPLRQTINVLVPPRCGYELGKLRKLRKLHHGLWVHPQRCPSPDPRLPPGRPGSVESVDSERMGCTCVKVSLRLRRLPTYRPAKVACSLTCSYSGSISS